MTMQFLWRFIITQERCTILFSIQCHINCLLVFHKNRQYSSRRLLHSASLPNTTFFPVPNYTPGWREDTLSVDTLPKGATIEKYLGYDETPNPVPEVPLIPSRVL